MSITSTEVFEFMGLDDSQRAGNSSMVNTLIPQAVKMIENYIGRKITVAEETIKIHDGRYCSIIGDKIYLQDQYFDIYSISSLKIDGVAMTENTDYVLQKPNVIELIDQSWSSEKLGIEITGYFGMGSIDDSDVVSEHAGLKAIVIETVAVMSGLWARVLNDGQGNNFVVSRNTLPKFIETKLNGYRQYVI
jgi:hypothetical protein